MPLAAHPGAVYKSDMLSPRSARLLTPHGLAHGGRMSHILEFSVDDLAGKTTRYHQTLQRDLNIFFGNNGSGKTSLMKILHSAIQGDAAILENVPFTRAEVTFFSLTFDRAFTRTITKAAEPEAPEPHTEELAVKAFAA